MTTEPNDDGLDRFITDNRSGLAKLVGDGPVPHRAFPFPGAGGRFGEGTRFAVRALDAESKSRALANAVTWLTTKGGWTRDALYEQNGAAVLDLECKVQVLARALVQPDDARKAFVSGPDELRKLLESDEIAALFEQYLDYEEERSPLAKLRSWEEVEPALVAVGKGYATKTSLLRFDSATRLYMLHCMAEQLFGTPTTPPSSDTSPASDSSE
jgi:hypothetical protein